MKRVALSAFFFVVVLTALVVGFVLGLTTAAFAQTACRFPIAQERPKWQAAGLTIMEVRNPKLFMAEFKDKTGEATPADAIYVLAKDGAPNVILVFAVHHCAANAAVIPKRLYRIIANGYPA